MAAPNEAERCANGANENEWELAASGVVVAAAAVGVDATTCACWIGCIELSTSGAASMLGLNGESGCGECGVRGENAKNPPPAILISIAEAVDDAEEAADELDDAEELWPSRPPLYVRVSIISAALPALRKCFLNEAAGANEPDVGVAAPVGVAAAAAAAINPPRSNSALSNSRGWG